MREFATLRTVQSSKILHYLLIFFLYFLSLNKKTNWLEFFCPPNMADGSQFLTRQVKFLPAFGVWRTYLANPGYDGVDGEIG